MEPALAQFMENFTALPIAGKKVPIPYWRNRFYANGRRIQGPFGGKGTPAEIRRATLKKAEKLGFGLSEMTVSEIRRFMREKKIGLDCSGFAFQILDFLRPGFWRGLQKAPGSSPKPIRRFNSRALTNGRNSRRIGPIWQNIKVGDIIPAAFTQRLDHVMVIVDVGKKAIEYAHSSGSTIVSGPHRGRIYLRDSRQPLWRQQWPEQLKSGSPLLGKVQPVLEKIGIRRLRPFMVG